MQTLSRRRFLSQAGLSTLALGAGMGASSRVQAIAPISRRGPARLRLSLAGYSFRQFFKHNQGKTGHTGPQAIDLFDFVDFCSRHDCDAELTGYYFPLPVEDGYLLRLKHHAHLRGVTISGTAVGNTFTLPIGDQRSEQIAMVKHWIDHAALLGTPHIRIFAGSQPAGMPKAQARALCLSALEECCAVAATRGVFLGLENHGGIVTEPDDLLDLVRSVDSPWLGINLDTGNFRTEDPYADLVRCLPYTVNVQLKVEMHPRGQPRALADLPRLVKILRDGQYQGFVALEYEATEDPWVAVPRYLRELRNLGV
jgi:sugar phosphate isomerase/epimerase